MQEIEVEIHEKGEYAHDGTRITPRTIKQRFHGVYGSYNPESKKIKFSMSEDETIDRLIRVIRHEYLHAVLHDLEGMEATKKLDNIDRRRNPLL